MRIRLIAPKGTITPEITIDALSLTGIYVSDEIVNRWTHLERLLAYDWAMREHLHASDNAVKLRPRPSFLGPIPSVQVCG